jgi:hypothetical protein
MRRGSAARALVPKGASANASWPTSLQRSSRFRRRQRMTASDSALGNLGPSLVDRHRVRLQDGGEHLADPVALERHAARQQLWCAA